MDAIQRKRDKARLRVRKFRAIKKALQEIEEPSNTQDESLSSFSIKSEDIDIEGQLLNTIIVLKALDYLYNKYFPSFFLFKRYNRQLNVT